MQLGQIRAILASRRWEPARGCAQDRAFLTGPQQSDCRPRTRSAGCALHQNLPRCTADGCWARRAIHSELEHIHEELIELRGGTDG